MASKPAKPENDPEPSLIYEPAGDEFPVVKISIEQLVMDAGNPRMHDETNLGVIDGSLSRYGQQEALLVQKSTGRIIAGNGRVEVLKKKGVKHVYAKLIDVDDKTAEQMSVWFNRSAETGSWDMQRLHERLSSFTLRDLETIHFDPDEINCKLDELPFLGEANGEESERAECADDPGAEISKADELQQKWQTTTGQLWVIPSGTVTDESHRLLCGDSSDAKAIGWLMDGRKAGLLATDPPYGVNYTATKQGMPCSGLGHAREHYGDIAGDDLQDEKLQAFLESVFRACLPHLDHAAWYLWHAHLTQGFFSAAAAAAANVVLHRQIIWKKPGFVLTRSGMYHWQHEPCFYGWVKGHQPKWLGSKSQTSVWEFPREKGARHPTQKPVALFATPIANHLDFGEIALEPFCGSGTQLVAAEQLGRLCYASEIEPKYVAVALERLAAMGLEPYLSD